MAKEPLKLFVASATESQDMVEAILLNLGDEVDIVPWAQVFGPSAHTLDRYLKAASEIPFGLFIFSPVVEVRNISDPVDPDRVYRGPRDNVVLEAGVFFGQYGKSHTVILEPRGLPEYKQPSDLKGFISIEYDYIVVEKAQEADNVLTSLCDALKLPCAKVMKHIQDVRHEEKLQENTLNKKDISGAKGIKSAVAAAGSAQDGTIGPALGTSGPAEADMPRASYTTDLTSVDGWGFSTQFLTPLEAQDVRLGQPVVSGVYGMGIVLTPASVMRGVLTVIVRFGSSDIPIRLDIPRQLYDPFKHREG